jgi:hypothetical protein
MLDAPHAPTIRSSAVTFAGLGEKEGTIHRGKMAEQTRMAGISTIGMVSKLALEIDKPEVSVLVMHSNSSLYTECLCLADLPSDGNYAAAATQRR